MQMPKTLENGLAPNVHPSVMKEAFSQIIRTKLAKYGEGGETDQQEYEATVRLMAEGRITRDDEREMLMCFYGRRNIVLAELACAHNAALDECAQKHERLTQTQNALEGTLTLLEAIKYELSSRTEHPEAYQPDTVTIH